MPLQNIQPLSYFRANARAVMAELEETGNPIILTQNGKAAAVLVSPGEWEKHQESMAMLRLLTLRRQEAMEGSGVDFEEGMDRIDNLMDERRAR